MGVSINNNLQDIFELNYVPKLEKLKEILRIWSMRDLSPIGKITIVKSLGISQLVFLLSVLPKPPDKFLKDLNSIIFNFIWSGKPDKISRNTIIGDYEKRSLKMIHIPSVITGLKVAWIKRFLDVNNDGNWKCFLQILYESILEVIYFGNVTPNLMRNVLRKLRMYLLLKFSILNVLLPMNRH